jgi:hypothetical protein
MKRGGILTNISIKIFKRRLTMRAGESKLPSFWRNALRSIRTITLIRDKITRESQRSLSLWHDPILPPPPIALKFKEAWASLGTHTVLDTLDPKTERFYTKEYNSLYLEEGDKVTIGGHTCNREGFLNSWNTICQHMAFNPLNQWWGEEETRGSTRKNEMMQEEMARHMQLKIEHNIEDQDKITVTISPDSEDTSADFWS